MVLTILPVVQGYLQTAFSAYIQLYQAAADTVTVFFLRYARSILDALHIGFDTAFLIALIATSIIAFTYAAISIVVLFRKPPAEKKWTGTWPTVTIQIPTYNELAALNCAECCLAFDYPKEKMTIMIGDDSNDPAISRAIDTFAKKHANVVVTRRGENIGFKPGNLNHMLTYTTSEYLVIFDSDFLPKKDFLKRVLSPMLYDENIAAVQARWRISNFSKNAYSRIGGTIPLLTHHVGLPFLMRVKGNGFIAGSAEAIRMSELRAQGGWRSGALTEDIEYSLRLTAAGKRIMYLEQLECACESPFTFTDLCRQQKRWAFGVITAAKQHWSAIIFAKRKFVDKLNLFLLLGGYIVTVGLFLLITLGVLSIVTHRPEPIQWELFFSATVRNILYSSGFVVVTVVALAQAGYIREIPRTLLASFTVGIAVAFPVTNGISKAIINRPMQWYMLKKEGNEQRING